MPSFHDTTGRLEAELVCKFKGQVVFKSGPLGLAVAVQEELAFADGVRLLRLKSVHEGQKMTDHGDFFRSQEVRRLQPRVEVEGAVNIVNTATAVLLEAVEEKPRIGRDH